MRCCRCTCAAILGLAVTAAAQDSPKWVWHIGWDAPGYDYVVKFNVSGKTLFETHHPTTSGFPAKPPPPLECMSECFNDPGCHGFVLWNKECWFRGGKGESPQVLMDAKIRRSDMTLFILWGEHPTTPKFLERLRSGNSLVYVGGGVTVLLLLLFCTAWLLAYRRKAARYPWQPAPKGFAFETQAAKSEEKPESCDNIVGLSQVLCLARDKDAPKKPPSMVLV